MIKVDWGNALEPYRPRETLSGALVATGLISVLEGLEEDSPLVTEQAVGERLGVLDERGSWLRAGHRPRPAGLPWMGTS